MSEKPNLIFFTRKWPINLLDCRPTVWEHTKAGNLGVAKAVATLRGHNQVGLLVGDYVRLESDKVEHSMDVWKNSN